ncbi:MAG: carboxypeptidase-like regulatory domain-containing protein, partial [Acidobacteria bacterium]|nr:carboxypeptidase-like regulatory domain-containing protein [Acidobacteriota bacterium]
ANSNQPPYVLLPPSLDIVAGTMAEISFVAEDPDSNQPVQINFNGPAFATLLANRRTIRLSPSANDVGPFALTLTVTDNAGSGFSLLVRGNVRAAAATTGTVTGVVRNAATGQPLAGATVAIANTTLTATSAANGAYTINNVAAGARTLTASATGFAATQLAVNIVAGQTLTQNISLSPTLATGQLRITVNWTKDTAGAPDDLDAHLFGPLGNNQCFHVFFDDTGSLTAAPFAALEVDNVELSGHPPTETIRIAQPTAGLYRFFLHDYESEYPDGIARSRATVQVFGSNGLLRSYVAPTGTGEYWHVFELNGQTGALTDINQLAAAAPAFTCGGGSGATVVDHRTAADPIPANCVAPTLKTAFLTTDPLVWQWTVFNGVTSGDVTRWEFIQPNGSIYNTQTYTWPQSGNFCIWRGILIANNAAASLPGNWQVRVYYKDALIVTDNFTIGTSAVTENFSRQRVTKSRRVPH